jgi:hypothetical protein
MYNVKKTSTFLEAAIRRTGITSLYIILSVGILFIVNCGPPSWIYKGSGAYNVGKKRVFYGVGKAKGIKNEALLRATADNRARAEIFKIIDTYVSVFAKDYIASTTNRKRLASFKTTTFRSALLLRAKIVDRWRDQKDGTQFSLCEFDLLAFKNALDEYEDLDESVKDYFRKNAERLHQQVE